METTDVFSSYETVRLLDAYCIEEKIYTEEQKKYAYFYKTAHYIYLVIDLCRYIVFYCIDGYTDQLCPNAPY